MKGSSAGYQLSASLSGSDGASQGQTNTNAQVGAGETLTVKSGQDTTIAGANLGGKDVKMDVGRDLTVASLQDTASSSSSNYSVGATVTVGPAPGFAGSQTGNSGSLGGGSGSSSSAWVSGQTSIIGSNSVDIRTEKNTHVEGAVIAAEKRTSVNALQRSTERVSIFLRWVTKQPRRTNHHWSLRLVMPRIRKPYVKHSS